MLNPANQNEELGARVLDALLKVRFSRCLTEDEMHALVYACGFSTEQWAPIVGKAQKLRDMDCEIASLKAELEQKQREELGWPKSSPK
jgi:hypothetical protein